MEGKGGPGPLRRVRPVPGDGLRYVFNGILCIQSVENPIRKVHSVKYFRLRRATAAQRASVVRKPLYLVALVKFLDLRGPRRAPLNRPKKGGAREAGPRLQHCPWDMQYLLERGSVGCHFRDEKETIFCY